MRRHAASMQHAGGPPRSCPHGRAAPAGVRRPRAGECCLLRWPGVCCALACSSMCTWLWLGKGSISCMQLGVSDVLSVIFITPVFSDTALRALTSSNTLTGLPGPRSADLHPQQQRQHRSRSQRRPGRGRNAPGSCCRGAAPAAGSAVSGDRQGWGQGSCRGCSSKGQQRQRYRSRRHCK